MVRPPLIKILIYHRIEISSCTSLLTTRLDWSYH